MSIEYVSKIVKLYQEYAKQIFALEEINPDKAEEGKKTLCLELFKDIPEDVIQTLSLTDKVECLKYLFYIKYDNTSGKDEIGVVIEECIFSKAYNWSVRSIPLNTKIGPFLNKELHAELLEILYTFEAAKEDQLKDIFGSTLVVDPPFNKIREKLEKMMEKDARNFYDQPGLLNEIEMELDEEFNN